VASRNRRLDQRLLHGVLGHREVGPAADEDADHLRHERPDVVDHSVIVAGTP
jgi:hypothetical protein